MKKILISLCLTFALMSQAQAATAFLQSCRGTSSVTGQFIYVGTYSYSGRMFEMTFQSWCPQNVEVY